MTLPPGLTEAEIGKCKASKLHDGHRHRVFLAASARRVGGTAAVSQ